MGEVEVKHFLPWVFTRALGYLALDHSSFPDQHIRSEIKCLQSELRMAKRSFSPEALSGGYWGLHKKIMEDFELEQHTPGNYSGFINFCSWGLNREYRALHDEVAAYLHA